MSMMKFLRKHMNKLLWVLVIFIAVAFGVSATMTDVIKSWMVGKWAEMFGRQVSDAEFRSVRHRLSTLQGSSNEIKEDDVWEYMALIEEARRSGITVANRELEQAILQWYRQMKFREDIYSSDEAERNRKIEFFSRLTEKQRREMLKQIPFDPSDYNRIVSNRMNMSIPEFEATYREALLISKLQSLISKAAVASSSSVYEEFIKDKHQRKIDYLRLNSDDYRDRVKFTEEDLKKFYEERKGEYMEPERVAFEYVIARYDDVKVPAAKEEELKKFYERKKHIYFRKDLDQEEVPAAEGFYKTYDEARAEVLDFYTRDQKGKKAKELVEKVHKEINALDKITLLKASEVAAKQGLQAGETKPFAVDEYFFKLADEFGRCMYAMRMFDEAADIKELSQAKFEESQTCEKGAFIYRLSRHIPKHHKAFEEVRSDLEASYANKRAGEVAEEEAKRLIEDARKNKCFTDALILEEKLARVSTGFFKRRSNEGRIETIKDNEFPVISAAFEVEKAGGFAEPVRIFWEGKPVYYLIQYKERKEPPPSEFLKNRSDIITQKHHEVEGDFLEGWKKDLIRRANIQKYYLKGSDKEQPEEQPEKQPEGKTGEEPQEPQEPQQPEKTPEKPK